MIFRVIKFLNKSKALQYLLAFFFSPVNYSRIIYAFIFYKYIGRLVLPNLRNPRTFNEKILYLKLYERNPYACIVANRQLLHLYLLSKAVSLDYLPQVLGYYSSSQSLYQKLVSLGPGSYFLKANHASGLTSFFTVGTTTILDLHKLSHKASKWLDFNYAFVGNEYQYSMPKYMRSVVLEKSISDSVHNVLDYKVFISNARVLFIQVDFDRHLNHTRAYFDSEWRFLDFSTLYPKYTGTLPSRPPFLSEMIDISLKLSFGFKFLRVDYLVVDNKFYIGELTLHHEGGFAPFTEQRYDEYYGSLLVLD